LGKEFDGRLQRVNLQETALNMAVLRYTRKVLLPEKYRDAIKANMLALKQAFPDRATITRHLTPGESFPTIIIIT